ncbi:putative MFS-type transporter [Diplodia seriata]|uniref:Putative MFS-type transporter n=1 Tax=Diplodia seriata TaxID=420778 RepID=A0A1S8BD42_9PEZI|nr:putative MFS-type transporter [Diplodia seriata]
MAASPEKQAASRLSAPAPSELERGLSTSNSEELVLAKDGTVLVPQPSSNPDDPLNWSWTKKHVVLCALIPGCLLSDWALTWGSVLFQLQAPEWHMSVQAVSQSMSPGIFMQGPGGILAVPLCQRYGRLPVLFWSQFLTLIVTIGATFADSYASFTAMRTLQGFFGAAPQVIGLSMIHDMFFFHERARKINIWAASFLIGPYLGPFISSLIISKLNWREDFGVLAGFYGLSVLMVVSLGEETLYERNVSEKPKDRSIAQHISSLLGIEGARVKGRPGLWTVTKHQYSLLARPYLFAPSKSTQMLSRCHRTPPTDIPFSCSFCHASHHVDDWPCVHDLAIRSTASTSWRLRLLLRCAGHDPLRSNDRDHHSRALGPLVQRLHCHSLHEAPRRYAPAGEPLERCLHPCHHWCGRPSPLR